MSTLTFNRAWLPGFITHIRLNYFQIHTKALIHSRGHYHNLTDPNLNHLPLLPLQFLFTHKAHYTLPFTNRAFPQVPSLNSLTPKSPPYLTEPKPSNTLFHHPSFAWFFNVILFTPLV